MTSLSKKGSFKLSLSQKEAIKTCTDSGQISCLSDNMGTWIQKWKGTKRKSKLKAVYKMLTSSSSSSWSQLSWFSSFSATLFAIFSVQHWSHTCAHAAGNTGCLFREIPRDSVGNKFILIFSANEKQLLPFEITRNKTEIHVLILNWITS